MLLLLCYTIKCDRVKGFYQNTIKDPQCYAVQVSDTTMMTIAP